MRKVLAVCAALALSGCGEPPKSKQAQDIEVADVNARNAYARAEAVNERVTELEARVDELEAKVGQ